MKRTGMSLLLFSLVAASWFFIPVQYSHADEYQYKSERSETTTQVAPPPVVEHDRTIIEHEAPPPPREGRFQAWWHRNIHGD